MERRKLKILEGLKATFLIGDFLKEHFDITEDEAPELACDLWLALVDFLDLEVPKEEGNYAAVVASLLEYEMNKEK